MVDAGAGLYLEDSDTNSESLLANILELVNNPVKLSDIQKAASKLAKFDGVQKIVEQINS